MCSIMVSLTFLTKLSWWHTTPPPLIWGNIIIRGGRISKFLKNRSLFSLETKLRYMAETKNSKNANYTLLPHRILDPSPPWDPKKSCHKIWVHFIQNDRTKHTNWARKLEIKKSEMGPRNVEKTVKIWPVWPFVGFWTHFH